MKSLSNHQESISLSENKKVPVLDEDVSGEYQQVAREFKEFNEQMKNPLVVGALLNKLSEERSSSNLLLKEINAKLDRLLDLEARIASMEKKLDSARTPLPSKAAAPASETMLPEVDEQIVSFVKEKGAACAADVKEKFGYKGVNAACSRLNRLFDQGLLRKNK